MAEGDTECLQGPQDPFQFPLLSDWSNLIPELGPTMV